MNSTFEMAKVTGYEIAGTVLAVASCAARMPALLQRAPATAPSSSAMVHVQEPATDEPREDRRDEADQQAADDDRREGARGRSP